MSSWDKADDSETWQEGAALVRPYALVRGRTHSTADALAVEAMLETTPRGRASELGFEQGEILGRCVVPCSIAELAVHLHVPVGVARVLVGDLVRDGLLEVHQLDLELDALTDRVVLERVLAGLEAL